MTSSNPALEQDADTQAGVNLQLAQFASGCFWGAELAFQGAAGVAKTEVGYTQGHLHEPTYKLVCGDDTGHAEVVRLHFDPAVCSYGVLLALFWSRHNPTTLNRQGNDVGTQYRSGIYYYSEDQAKFAWESMEGKQELEAKIVTEILPAKRFYRAEEYHQQYLKKVVNLHTRDAMIQLDAMVDKKNNMHSSSSCFSMCSAMSLDLLVDQGFICRMYLWLPVYFLHSRFFNY